MEKRIFENLIHGVGLSMEVCLSKGENSEDACQYLTHKQAVLKYHVS